MEFLRNKPYRFFCKIHSKGGEKLPTIWRGALLRGTIGSVARVLDYQKIFRENQEVMLGGSKELYLYGPSYLMGNSDRIQRMLMRTGLDFAHTKQDWGFFAGTFFWIRRDVTDKLLECVSFEEFGNEAVLRDGQLAHAVERMFGILPSAMGGAIALAEAADLSSKIEFTQGYPSGVHRLKRGIIPTLRDYHRERINKWMDGAVQGRNPGLGFSRVANTARHEHLNHWEYAIITPTGDRAPAFNRCIHMVMTQTVPPKEWIIIDDGTIPMKEQLQIPNWATYIRRERRLNDPPHTVSLNILEALKHISQDKVVIFEDDDWYSPYYAEFMLPYLEEYDMAGLNTIRYYHLIEGMWKIGIPPKHTAFAQTVFKRGPAFSHLKSICESNLQEIRERGVLDRHWWQSFDGEKYLIKNHPCLHMGLKGGFGRTGIAEGHKPSDPDYKLDSDRSYIQKSIGPDALFYYRWQKKFRKPFVIYTSIAGCYDNLKKPIASNSNFDFYVFSDTPQTSVEPWGLIPFDAYWKDPVRTAKKPKILPHLYFPDYEWSLWIDANLFILDDLSLFVNASIEGEGKVALFEHPERNRLSEEVDELIRIKGDDPALIRKQFDGYLKLGWNDQLPLYECNFMIRRHNDPAVIRAMTFWWHEITNNSRRDQVSFSFSMWKSGIAPMSLRPKGKSVRNIPEIFYPLRPSHGHIKHDSVMNQIEKHVMNVGKRLRSL